METKSVFYEGLELVTSLVYFKILIGQSHSADETWTCDIELNTSWYDQAGVKGR